jgi:hypothetical protein
MILLLTFETPWLGLHQGRIYICLLSQFNGVLIWSVMSLHSITYTLINDSAYPTDIHNATKQLMHFIKNSINSQVKIIPNETITFI